MTGKARPPNSGRRRRARGSHGSAQVPQVTPRAARHAPPHFRHQGTVDGILRRHGGGVLATGEESAAGQDSRHDWTSCHGPPDHSGEPLGQECARLCGAYLILVNKPLKNKGLFPAHMSEMTFQT